MRIISTTTSIAVGLAFIISSAVLAAHFFDLFPDAAAVAAEHRAQLAHVVAAQCSDAATSNDAKAISASFTHLLSAGNDVLSAGLRAPDGKLLVQAGPHGSLWNNGQADAAPGQQIAIPILQNGHPWATVEMHFRPAESASWAPPVLRITLFIAASGFLGALFFLKRVLKHLDPSSVIPDRVRAMLDALAEGVIIMDTSEQVMMANEAFCRITQSPLHKIQGRRLSDLPWLASTRDGGEWLPFLDKIKAGDPVRRQALHIHADPDRDQDQRTLVINAVPILGTSGARRGILMTFDDVTSVEAANDQLRKTLDELALSRDEIARKNRELEVLASRDPLTGCLNRRSFMRAFEEAWAAAAASRRPLACIMLDLDHFKQVNDQYGHAVGDQVLKQLGALLQSATRAGDLACRYGGEEFCLLLPDTAFDEAHAVAERFRQTVLAASWPINHVTASIGVSGSEAGAADPRQLLEQADKSLYAAKRTGRNRVTPWGDPSIDATEALAVVERRGVTAPVHVRLLADALFAALSHRDPGTAEHSRRVADVVCSVAEDLWTSDEVEMLRLAALLHDLGKLAIPDSILRKAGPLTPAEWEIMRRHEDVGADLILEATGSAHLADLVRVHHAWFGGTPHDPTLPSGAEIPPPCRLLLIGDAYDALVSDRCYRKGTSHAQACAELRRCAGTQFDPQLVETFIARLDRARGIKDRLLELQTQDTAAAATSVGKALNEIANIAASPRTSSAPAQPASSRPAESPPSPTLLTST